MPPAGKLVAPGRIMLRSAQAFGFVGAEERSNSAVRPGQTPLGGFITRALPGRRDSQDAAIALHHHITGIARCRRHERNAVRRSCRHPSPYLFSAGPRLAEAATGKHKPHPPLPAGRQLVRPGPEFPFMKECSRFCGRQGSGRSTAEKPGVHASRDHLLRNPPDRPYWPYVGIPPR
jgi:hypothetical protein